jgi:PKD repeat protein
MIARSSRRRVRAGSIAALLLSLVAASCDKVPLTAPSQSTIELVATAPSVPANGSIDVIATVTEQPGTPVQNGTVVSFTTTLGHIDPSEAQTTNGKATARLVADGRSGTATITAYSGGATKATVDVLIGAAAADTIVVRAEPANVPRTGGTVQIVAQVRDASGNALSAVPVTFTATAGQIQTPTATTDANGEARTAFTTSSKATVTARAGGKSADIVVDVAALPTISISATPAAPTAGQAVTFTLTIDASAATNPVKNVRIDYGDGDFEDLGAPSGSTSVAHIYASDGTKTVTVTVTDTAGQQASQVLVVNVLPKTPVAVNLTYSPTSPAANDVVTFTATVTVGAGVAIERYDWLFGDGSTKSTTGNQTTKIYSASGTFHASVTVTATDGSTGIGAADIKVGP